jgi:hypothetical protein
MPWKYRPKVVRPNDTQSSLSIKHIEFNSMISIIKHLCGNGRLIENLTFERIKSTNNKSEKDTIYLFKLEFTLNISSSGHKARAVYLIERYKSNADFHRH